ncbi:MAG: adenylate/guanylate cyclase domain-containing protein [Desulfomonilaceae bacterium]
MTDLDARTRQICAFPVNRENIRVFTGGFGNRLFTEKAGSRHFPSIRPCPGLSQIGKSLLGLYWRNLISTPLAFLMVLALNLFTPLGFFDEVRAILVTKGAWKLLLLVLLSIITVTGILQYLVQRPLAQAIKNLCTGNAIPQPLSEKAERRLLNLPLILALINLATVPFLPAFTLGYFYYFMELPARPAVFIFSRIIIAAMVSSTLSFFLVEEFSRKNIIARYFPRWKLSAPPGSIRMSIRLRIRALYIGGTVIPMIIVLSTLLLVWWDLGFTDASLMAFSREVLVFTGVLYGIFIVCALKLNSLVENSIVDPIRDMLRVMGKVTHGDFSTRIGVVSNDEIGILADTGNEMIHALSEREMIRDTFGKYVSPEIRDEILAGRIPLNGKRTEATILFCDLRNFTPFVEKNDPEEVIMSMRAYFTVMQRAIAKFGGLVLQYVGDEIEAVFGVPLPYEDHPDKAVLAALEMRSSLEALNKLRLREGKSELRHGIGIHTGEVLAGNIGSDDRLSYALIGDTVNLASRIQGLTKVLGCDLLISEATQRRLRNSFPLEKHPPRFVRGHSKPLTLYGFQGT